MIIKLKQLEILKILNLNSNFLGENVVFNDGKVRLLVNPYDTKYSGFFDLKTSNVDIEINTVFTNSELLSLKINKFLTPIQDFRMNFDLKSSVAELSGNKLSIQKIDFKEESFFF